MLLFDGCERNYIGSFKKRSKTQSIIERANRCTTTEKEVLSRVDPLLLRRFKEGRYPTAKDTGSFKEIDSATLRNGGFCGGDSRQASTNNA